MEITLMDQLKENDKIKVTYKRGYSSEGKVIVTDAGKMQYTDDNGMRRALFSTDGLMYKDIKSIKLLESDVIVS